MTADFSLGDEDPDEATDPSGEPQPIDLVEVLLGAVCDDFNISEDGRTLHLSKRMGVQHA